MHLHILYNIPHKDLYHHTYSVMILPNSLLAMLGKNKLYADYFPKLSWKVWK